MTSSVNTAHDLWLAPTPHSGVTLDATVRVPGSKSLTNRYLVLAALADGPSVVRGTLKSRDSDLMIAALQQLGAVIVPGSEVGEYHVSPIPQGYNVGDITLDCGLAGTVMRFIPAVAALVTGRITIDGDEGARIRPMKPIIEGLQRLGVDIEDTSDGFLPFTVHATGAVLGGQVDVDASGSSQFVSGLLLAASRFTDGVSLTHQGDSLPSLPHIDMTVEVLREAQVQVTQPSTTSWVVAAGPISAQDVQIEPDLSNATPFMAAALVLGGTVRIPAWPAKTTQPGALAPEIFARMGATVTYDESVLSIQGTGHIKGLGTLDLSAAGELAPTFAALCALADAPTVITGIAHLRGHETDRLAALSQEINRLGGQCVETPDGLNITPVPLQGGVFHTYHDHRMATAGAIIGLRTPDVFVENIATTGKTLPGFDAMWNAMLEQHTA
ncbi:3-phosphoshikimate 1-carboxyvinyltransferase [Timonella sp. A28]|uniref:3-phosphoshikimate 1-carboxyvinyltransferase n=1 Tax=Timonella sp. A28 TaxID=3442640 RepID=UPI003EBC2C5E